MQLREQHKDLPLDNAASLASSLSHHSEPTNKTMKPDKHIKETLRYEASTTTAPDGIKCPAFSTKGTKYYV